MSSFLICEQKVKVANENIKAPSPKHKRSKITTIKHHWQCPSVMVILNCRAIDDGKVNSWHRDHPLTVGHSVEVHPANSSSHPTNPSNFFVSQKFK